MKRSDTHKQFVLIQLEKLKAKGFRCIPLIKPIPDVIAIKGDNLEVYAVEVIHTVDPKVIEQKYKKVPWYDDVILAFYPMERPVYSVNPCTLVDERGRTTLPERVREKHKINKGCVLQFESLSDDKVLIEILAR